MSVDIEGLSTGQAFAIAISYCIHSRLCPSASVTSWAGRPVPFDTCNFLPSLLIQSVYLLSPIHSFRRILLLHHGVGCIR